MEISKVEVFECPKCNKISRDQENIISCLKKHRQDELKEEKEKPFLDFSNTIASFMVNNLTSLRPEEVGNHLVSAAKMMGFDIKISSITGGRIGASNWESSGKECAEYQIRASYSKLPGRIKIPRGFKGKINYNLERILEGDFSFSRFCDLLTGVTSGGGGGGEKDFSYSFRLYLDRFPEINKKWNLLKELRTKKGAYISEKNRLTAEYEKHRKPVVLISDIKYQEIKSEYDEVKEQIEALRVKSAEIATRMNSRAHELVSKDSPTHTTPDSNFDFDSELEKKLTQEIGA